MSQEYKFMGYAFETEEALSEAKKEAEAVAYLRKKTDFENAGQVLSLYNRMIDRKMVNTPIGLDFLKELRDAALKSGTVEEGRMKPLPELGKPKEKQVAKKIVKVDADPLKALQKQNTGLKLVILGLIVIIIGMFIIVLTGKSSPLKSVYEQEIQDKYAYWEEDLTRREEALRQKLLELEEQGITIEKESDSSNGTD